MFLPCHWLVSHITITKTLTSAITDFNTLLNKQPPPPHETMKKDFETITGKNAAHLRIKFLSFTHIMFSALSNTKIKIWAKFHLSPAIAFSLVKSNFGC